MRFAHSRKRNAHATVSAESLTAAKKPRWHPYSLFARCSLSREFEMENNMPIFTTHLQDTERIQVFVRFARTYDSIAYVFELGIVKMLPTLEPRWYGTKYRGRILRIFFDTNHAFLSVMLKTRQLVRIIPLLPYIRVRFD